MTILTRDEQRIIEQRKGLISVGLWCHLKNLIGEIKKGDTSKLSELQEFIQYAPPEMKLKLLSELEAAL